jgi:hypothetical protein
MAHPSWADYLGVWLVDNIGLWCYS